MKDNHSGEGMASDYLIVPLLREKSLGTGRGETMDSVTEIRELISYLRMKKSLHFHASYVPLEPQFTLIVRSLRGPAIHHLHISHNIYASFALLPLPKICSYKWLLQLSQDKPKTMLMQNLGGQEGALCKMCN